MRRLAAANGLNEVADREKSRGIRTKLLGCLHKLLEAGKQIRHKVKPGIALVAVNIAAVSPKRYHAWLSLARRR